MGKIYFLLALGIIILFIITVLQYFEIKGINNKMKLMEKAKNTLYEVSEKIVKVSSEEEVYNLILYTAIDLIPNATKGSILTLGEDNLFHYNTVIGFSDNIKSIALKREEIYLYSINNFSETAIIKNPNAFDESAISVDKIESMKKLEALDIVCTLSSPIYIEEKLTAIINIDSTSDDEIFTEEDIALMNYIKSELQLALKNSFIQSRLRYMANFDELTGLFNRRYFKQFLDKELLRIRRYKTESCLALIDLDDFKLINDTYGHNMGDKALRLFADVLRENIRKSDIYARMSGDEFVILFINCDKEKAVRRLETIRNTLSNRKLDNITISFSYGVNKIDHSFVVTPDDIFGGADKEMYRDKKNKEYRNIEIDKQNIKAK